MKAVSSSNCLPLLGYIFSSKYCNHVEMSHFELIQHRNMLLPECCHPFLRIIGIDHHWQTAGARAVRVLTFQPFISTTVPNKAIGLSHLISRTSFDVLKAIAITFDFNQQRLEYEMRYH